MTLWYFVAIKDDGEFQKDGHYYYDFPWFPPDFPMKTCVESHVFPATLDDSVATTQVEQHPMRAFKTREVANMSWSVATVQVGQLGHGMGEVSLGTRIFGLKKGWKNHMDVGQNGRPEKKTNM